MIDSHQHYWQVNRGDYGWMNDNPAVDLIRRDFLPADLDVARRACGIEKTVLVQAAPSTAETEFLLSLAASAPSIAKVVGWVDFERPGDRVMLEKFAENPAFAGVRPMIQDIADIHWMHRSDLRWAFDAVMELDLSFDALGFAAHLPEFERLFDRYPDMRIVIDHGMKPVIRNREFDDWAAGMARIAANTGVFCKLSGLLTEARPSDDTQDLAPYINHLLEVFPENRLMWGSDWPVVNLVSDYESWYTMTSAYVTDDNRRNWLFQDSAAEFYRIEAVTG